MTSPRAFARLARGERAGAELRASGPARRRVFALRACALEQAASSSCLRHYFPVPAISPRLDLHSLATRLGWGRVLGGIENPTRRPVLSARSLASPMLGPLVANHAQYPVARLD